MRPGAPSIRGTGGTLGPSRSGLRVPQPQGELTTLEVMLAPDAVVEVT